MIDSILYAAIVACVNTSVLLLLLLIVVFFTGLHVRGAIKRFDASNIVGGLVQWMSWKSYDIRRA